MEIKNFINFTIDFNLEEKDLLARCILHRPNSKRYVHQITDCKNLDALHKAIAQAINAYQDEQIRLRKKNPPTLSD